jgi:hypothetical protein
MTTSIVPAPKQLSLREANVAENWRKFLISFNNFVLATGYSAKPDAVKVGLLLSVIGEEAVELYGTFEWINVDDKVKLDPVLTKFESYCKPKASELVETYRFLSRRQEPGEPIDAFATALRTLAAGCALADKDRRIRDQVVMGIRDDRLRERLLREASPTLDKVLKIIRATELAEQHLKVIVGDNESRKVNKVFKQNTKTRQRKGDRMQTDWKDVDCRYCGSNHERKKEKCPAWGEDCWKCGKKNQFASKCLGEKGQPSSSSVGKVSAFTITGQENITKTLKVATSGETATFLIDTGASVNILPIKEYNRVTGDRRGKKLNKSTTTTIRTYGGKTWLSKGQTNLRVELNGNLRIIPIWVVNLDAMPLLSLKTSESLGLVKVMDCDGVSSSSRLQGQTSDAQSRTSHQQKVRIGQRVYGLTKDEMLRKYADDYEGLDELEGGYHIQTDSNIFNPTEEDRTRWIERARYNKMSSP